MNFRILSGPLILVAAALAAGCASTTAEPPVNGGQVGIADPSSSSGAATAAASADPNGYSLAQGDLIGIQVFDEPDLTLDARVSSSGNINYSYLGDVRVSGKTPLELEQHITSLLENGFLVNPSVNVTIKEFRPFFIGGEVRSPGSYPFQPGLTLGKAIAIAGGLTDRASTRRMFVVKAGGDVADSEKMSLDSPVSPGDTISIKEGFF